MYRRYIYITGENYKINHQQENATEARTRQEVQPRLLPPAQEGVHMRALQEDLLERQRHEETPSEKHQVPIGTREDYQRESPQAARRAESHRESQELRHAWETEQASSSIPPEQEEELSLRFSKLLAGFEKDISKLRQLSKNTSKQADTAC